MKTRYLIIALLVMSSFTAFSQHWSDLLSQPNPNYYEVKKAFDAEWQDKPYEKGQGYSLFKRWENFMLSHMDRQGYYDAKAFNEAFYNWNKDNKTDFSKSKGAAWSLVGPTNPPGPYGYNNNGIGRLKEIAFHPTDTNIFYVGSETGGLWKTTNCGKTYSLLSANWSNNEIHGISINAANANELWACTDLFLMHTTDAGANWQEINLGSSFSSMGVFIANFQKGILIAGDLSGVAKYSTNGTTWTTITGINGINSPIKDIVIHPTNSNIVYAVSKNALYKSTDGGMTFAPITTTGLSLGLENNRLAVSTIEPSSLWILTSTSDSLRNVYKSTNEGVNFTSILNKSTVIRFKTTTATSTAELFFGVQGSLHASIGVSNKNSNQLFIGGVGIFYTEDGGTNWYSALSGMADQAPHVDHLNIRYQPITDVPFSCNDGGLCKGLKTPDAKGNYIWQILNETLAITQMYDVSASYDGTRIVTSQQDNGTFIYDVNSQTWIFAKIGDGLANAFLPSTNNTIFAAAQNGVITVSVNGASFITLLGSTAFNEKSSFYTKMAIDPVTDGIIYNLRKNLYVTRNYANSWSDLSSTLTEDFTNGNFVIGYNNPNTIALYDRKTSLYVSTNAGTNWTKITVPTDAGGSILVYNVALHSSNNNILWVSSQDGTVYYSDNQGVTFTPYATWPKLSINKLMHVDGTTDELLIATSTGLYIKKNGSTILEEFAAGLPKVPVNDVEISYCTGDIYIATYGMGLWKSTIALQSSACCKKTPALPADFNSFLCASGKSIKVISNGAPYQWTYNGVAQTLTSDSLYTTAGGSYSVKSKTQTCETGTLYFDLLDIQATTNIPFCDDFETQATSDLILLRNNSTIPLAFQTNTTCTTKGTQTLSLKLSKLPNNLYNATNDSVIFILPNIDLTNAKTASLAFDIASKYSNYSNGANELEVAVSTDCGKTFQSLLSLKESDLASALATWDTVPASCADWKSFTADLTSYLGKELVVQFAIHSIVTTGQNFWGGNFFMDNICVNGSLSTTSVLQNITENSISIFPNPVYDILTVKTDELIRNLQVYDMQGRALHLQTINNQIDTKNIAAGQYILEITTNKGISNYTFIKN